MCWTGSAGLHGFITDDLIALNERGYANLLAVVSRALFNPDNFPDGAYKNFSAAGYFSRQGHGQIQLGPGNELVLDDEVNPASGDVSSLSVTSVLFNRDANQDR